MSTLLKRAVEQGSRLLSDDGNNPSTPLTRIPGWALLLIILTSVIFVCLYIVTVYTYTQLIPTLAMIESPHQAAIPSQGASTSADPVDPDLPLLNNYRPTPKKRTLSSSGSSPPPTYEDTEAEIVIPTKPITSSFRITLKHLRSRAGFFSRWRGFGLHIAYVIVVAMLTSILTSVTKLMFLQGIFGIVIEVMFARFHVAWIHFVIAEPNGRSPFARLRTGKMGRKLMPAVFLYALAVQAAVWTPMALGWLFGIHSALEEGGAIATDGQRATLGLKAMTCLLSGLVVGLFIALPCAVIMVRVAASMLPEEDESIVPFDRSFGGKVVPAIVGGTGKIGLKDAWTTFSWEGRRRLIKVYLKAWGIVIAIVALWMVVVGLEFKLGVDHGTKQV